MIYLNFIKDNSKVMYAPGLIYDDYYEQSWFDDPVVVAIAEKVDNIKHEWADYFCSDLTGKLSGKDISGGAKTLILAYLGFDLGKELPTDWLGENCYPVLGTFTPKKDITFCATSIPQLDDFGCTFISKQTGKEIKQYDDYMEEFWVYVYQNQKS